MEERIKQAIKDIKAEIKEEERNAEESDDVWGCCDKALSDGVLCGLQSGESYLHALKFYYDKSKKIK